MKKVAAALALLVALLLGSSGASAMPSEAELRSDPQLQNYRVGNILKVRGDEQRGYEVTFDYMDDNSVIQQSTVAVSRYHRTENVAPEEGGRFWKSPLISQPRDAYSLKRPAGSTTVAAAEMPASLPKFSKGVAWGIVAVSLRTGKVVRGKVTPSGADNRAGQQPATVIFEEPVDPDSRLLASDRWYNNTIFGRKRGELTIWNPGTAKWEKLVGGMWLERDPAHLALIAQTYGAPLEQIQHATVTPTETEQIPRRLGWQKVASPDGVRYTPVDLAIFKKFYAQPSLVRWHQRFANNGGLAIGIPPEPIGAAINVGVAALTATFDTRHNIPCLSTLRGGQSRFERDQAFYEGGGALTSRDFARARAEVSRMAGGQMSFEGVLAEISPASPTGYPQVYDWPGFWLEPKRVEIPMGVGWGREPNLRTNFSYWSSALRLFGGEVAPNATLFWGPGAKFGRYDFETATHFQGRGRSWSYGIWPELVTRHPWGGTDTTLGLLLGHRRESGDFGYRMSRRFGTLDLAHEAWFKGVELGKAGSVLSGYKASLLWETDGFLLASFRPVLYRSPHDIAVISAGPALLRFRHGPQGGGLMVTGQVLDGLYLSYGRYFGSRNFWLVSVDLYRIHNKLQQLRAEVGIYEIPWDSYFPKAVPAAAEPLAAPVTPVSAVTSLPAVQPAVARLTIPLPPARAPCPTAVQAASETLAPAPAIGAEEKRPKNIAAKKKATEKEVKKEEPAPPAPTPAVDWSDWMVWLLMRAAVAMLAFFLVMLLVQLAGKKKRKKPPQ